MIFFITLQKHTKDEAYMLGDQLKWNQKYEEDQLPDAPSSVVKRFFKLADGKKALDIAAGNGRNALFLADQGFAVDAVDISDTGLNLFAGKHANVHSICADLDNFDIPPNRYDLIINIKYLSRRLFPYIREALNRGGILIFQTFLDLPNGDKEQPLCRDYRLRENELLHAFLSLKILFYEEGNEESRDDAAHLATLVAVRIS
jgi:SAM-dependent methyltransferase